MALYIGFSNINVMARIDNFIITSAVTRQPMNKFSKTSYPRHTNHSNILTSGQPNKQKKSAFEEQRAKGPNDCQSVHTLIEKKIEIDPTLLFGNKVNLRNNKNISNQAEKVSGQQNKEFYSTTNDAFLKKNKERPQSKQQSRVKIPDSHSLSKRNQEPMQRPQTSKGQRNVVYRREARNKSLADESEHEIEVVTRESKTAFGSRRRHTAKQLEFQTSIDPQFLALFAN